MILCCSRQPMFCFCISLWALTLLNILNILRSALLWPESVLRKVPAEPQIAEVTLLENAEHTILSRIRYPDRKSSLIYGKPFSTHRKFVLGIPSLHRPWAPIDYLNSTLHSVIRSLDPTELYSTYIVVYLNDKSKSFRLKRARKLYLEFRDQIDSGVVQIIQAPANVYPLQNFSTILRTFKNSPGQVEWRSKMCLDFAFLMSYCLESKAAYFINLEDDVFPEKHFIRKAEKFIQSQSNLWSSIQLSEYLSIGRLYRTRDLDKLVEFILIFFNKMPVDWLMTEFDRMQLADNFKVYKINSSLFTHHGEISSKGLFLQQEHKLANQKYDKFKAKNPKNVTLLTTMRHYQYFTLNNSYFPSSLFFWCIPYAGGTLDVVFPKPLFIHRIRLVFGLESSDGRINGTDSLLDGILKSSNKLIKIHPGYAECDNFFELIRIHNSTRELIYNNFTSTVQCLKLEVGEKQDPSKTWLVIKLIEIN